MPQGGGSNYLSNIIFFNILPFFDLKIKTINSFIRVYKYVIHLIKTKQNCVAFAYYLV